ncbi:SDR family oxidoreductase [Bradyrhizobium sp. CCGUVB4N]|uniref:SDR family NAD(P)-dependent oxidoreductase n=1 Tax=Bradyrhizobium sp. CCGUVB4N TaxID=2949631 RepID=UPI0020B27CDD|nr:SDR family oxidoreductase [Bradyrhizobium sp. CCGUVB4N]MCP3384586.1 SDR family oxidoreductase [Bradyrhizobium sp. CCGUVB4N]
MNTAGFSVAVFGATGAIGQAICHWYQARGHHVVAIGRTSSVPKAADSTQRINWDIGSPDRFPEALASRRLNAVVWAQGMNFNDDIFSFDATEHQRIYSANVVFVLESLKTLLKDELLAPKARLCVISSIWQNIAKQKKMSYAITKSALQGLVQSLSIDLGSSGILVNAVLPGALDTPMTRANLSADQIARLEHMSPLGTLPSLDDVCNLVGFLCSEANTGITGQFIAADRGFSHARII